MSLFLHNDLENENQNNYENILKFLKEEVIAPTQCCCYQKGKVDEESLNSLLDLSEIDVGEFQIIKNSDAMEERQHQGVIIQQESLQRFIVNPNGSSSSKLPLSLSQGSRAKDMNQLYLLCTGLHPFFLSFSSIQIELIDETISDPHEKTSDTQKEQIRKMICAIVKEYATRTREELTTPSSSKNQL